MRASPGYHRAENFLELIKQSVTSGTTDQATISRTDPKGMDTSMSNYEQKRLASHQTKHRRAGQRRQRGPPGDDGCFEPPVCGISSFTLKSNPGQTALRKD